MITSIPTEARDLMFDCLDDYCAGRGQQFDREEAFKALRHHFPNLTSAQRTKIVDSYKNQLDNCKQTT